MFLFKEFALADANPMFARACAAEGEPLGDDFTIQSPRLFQCRLIAIREKDQAMEIAITDMADDTAGLPGCLGGFLGLQHGLCQAGDGDTNIGGDAAMPRLQGNGGPIGIVARLP